MNSKINMKLQKQISGIIIDFILFIIPHGLIFHYLNKQLQFIYSIKNSAINFEKIIFM